MQALGGRTSDRSFQRFRYHVPGSRNKHRDDRVSFAGVGGGIHLDVGVGTDHCVV